MKSSNSQKQILFLIIALWFSFNLNAQKWHCDIKPGVKFFSTTFVRNEYEEMNFTNIEFKHSKQFIFPRFNIEPEFYMHFYKPNSFWQYGLGLTTHNWAYTTFLNTDSDLLSLGTSSNLNVKNIQFNLVLTRLFKSEKNSLSNNRVSFGIGITSLYPRTQIDNGFLFSNNPIAEFNTAMFQFSNGSKWHNQMSFNFLVRFEHNFQLKTSKEDLFNLFVSYNQGFSNSNFLRIYYFGENLKANLVTSSLGSGFRVGISKTFSFEYLKQTKPTTD